MWNMFREIYRKKRNKDGQKGAATVEAVVVFVGFLFVIFTILNVVNFCRAQVLISNAVDTVTKELTQYSYLYNISGLQKFDSDIHDTGQTGKDNLNVVAGSVGNLYSAMSTAVGTSIEEGTSLANATMDGSVTEDMVTTALNSLQADGTNISTSINNMTTEFATVGDNPVLYMKSIVAVAGSEGLDALKSHLIAAPLAKALMVKHFGGSWSEADRQLEALGVVDGLDGMNFGMSTLFCEGEEEDVHIVLYYKMKVVQLFPWADFEATMCKESHARAWLGGDDVVVKVAAPQFDSTNTGSGGEEPPAEEEEAEGTEKEEEETAPDAEAIKAAMVEKYGQEVVDAVSDGEDTSAWTEDDWEYQIWLYWNTEELDEQIDETIGETADKDSLTSEQIQFMMIYLYGPDMVSQIMEDYDTSSWTIYDWMAVVYYYQNMNPNLGNEENSGISESDREKINKWEHTPTDELYLKYKDVYDNPKYYDQETGDIHWPPNDGFNLEKGVEDKVIPEGTILKRYGSSGGEFLGNTTDSFEDRALAPHSDGVEVHYYKLSQDYMMTTGEAAAWFGSDGGAEQFVVYKDKEKGTKYSIQELIDLKILIEVTVSGEEVKN